MGINWNKKRSTWLKQKPLSPEGQGSSEAGCPERVVLSLSLKVSMLQLDKALSNLVWYYSWPFFEQKVGLEPFWGHLQTGLLCGSVISWWFSKLGFQSVSIVLTFRSLFREWMWRITVEQIKIFNKILRITFLRSNQNFWFFFFFFKISQSLGRYKMDVMTQESHAETQKETVLPLNCKITLLSPPFTSPLTAWTRTFSMGRVMRYEGSGERKGLGGSWFIKTKNMSHMQYCLLLINAVKGTEDIHFTRIAVCRKGDIWSKKKDRELFCAESFKWIILEASLTQSNHQSNTLGQLLMWCKVLWIHWLLWGKPDTCQWSMKIPLWVEGTRKCSYTWLKSLEISCLKVEYYQRPFSHKRAID